MSIYAAVLYIVVPILAAVVLVFLKALITESRTLKKEPFQMSLPVEHVEHVEHDEKLTRVG
jgi:hypothetical protein